MAIVVVLTHVYSHTNPQAFTLGQPSTHAGCVEGCPRAPTHKLSFSCVRDVPGSEDIPGIVPRKKRVCHSCAGRSNHVGGS